MMDSSSISPNSPAPQQQSPAKLLSAQFSCPICNQVVVSLQDNELTYLSNHTHLATDQGAFVSSTDPGTSVSLVIYHLDPQRGDIQPGHEHLPGAFLNVSSLTITPQ